MERVEAELFTDGGNNTVVRLPGRRFPGVLIQGDSVSILRGDTAEAVDALDQGDAAGAQEAAGLLLADLDARSRQPGGTARRGAEVNGPKRIQSRGRPGRCCAGTRDGA